MNKLKRKIRKAIMSEISALTEKIHENELKDELERLGAELIGMSQKGKEYQIGVRHKGKELGFKVDKQWREARVFKGFSRGKVEGPRGGLYPVNTKSMFGLAKDLAELTAEAGGKRVRMGETAEMSGRGVRKIIQEEIRRLVESLEVMKKSLRYAPNPNDGRSDVSDSEKEVVDSIGRGVQRELGVSGRMSKGGRNTWYEVDFPMLEGDVFITLIKEAEDIYSFAVSVNLSGYELEGYVQYKISTGLEGRHVAGIVVDVFEIVEELTLKAERDQP